VVIHDFDIFGTSVRPTETHAELFVDTNTMLPLAIAFQGFQSIPWRYPQIVQSARDLQLPELTSRYGCDVREPPNPLAFR
jgi:hypothetical protein